MAKTVSIGDVVEYEIISKLPTITSEASYLTIYTFVDTFSKGVSYNKQDVTVTFYTDAAMQNRIASRTETDGKIILRGMEDEFYYLKEIATDSGFQLLVEEVELEITAEESETICGMAACATVLFIILSKKRKENAA